MACAFALVVPLVQAQDRPLQIAADGRSERELAAQHLLWRESTGRSFRRVAFLSPRHESALGQRVWMAPILLQELFSEAGAVHEFPRFGAIKPNVDAGESWVDGSQLTVYTTARRIRIAGRLYHQDTYAWFYPSNDPDIPLHYRGFRQTLARNGFPAIREVISSDLTERIFFVSKTLEQAAASQFGAPLAGRQFSVESALSKYPDVLVARVLADGAQPMGPFVYLDSSLVIPNLKCRCEPSQVGEFTLNHHYRLIRLDSFGSLDVEGVTPAQLQFPENAAQLEGVLRIPRSF